jgi:hypothetical protein
LLELVTPFFDLQRLFVVTRICDFGLHSGQCAFVLVGQLLGLGVDLSGEEGLQVGEGLEFLGRG